MYTGYVLKFKIAIGFPEDIHKKYFYISKICL